MPHPIKGVQAHSLNPILTGGKLEDLHTLSLLLGMVIGMVGVSIDILYYLDIYFPYHLKSSLKT